MSEREGLNYFVVAVRGGQWIAGFQYRQWADDWRDRYCATGLVLTQVEWMNVQSESLRDDMAREAMEPKANGGILGDPPAKSEEAP